MCLCQEAQFRIVLGELVLLGCAEVVSAVSACVDLNLIGAREDVRDAVGSQCQVVDRGFVDTGGSVNASMEASVKSRLRPLLSVA